LRLIGSRAGRHIVAGAPSQESRQWSSWQTRDEAGDLRNPSIRRRRLAHNVSAPRLAQ
jgi:hypothetical protein